MHSVMYRDGGRAWISMPLLLFPNTYQDVKQVDVKPWVVDAEQRKAIVDYLNSEAGPDGEKLNVKSI